MKPQRIQLSRKAGFNLQRTSLALNGLPAVNCARPSRWGNPFVVQFDPHPDYTPQTNAEAVSMYRDWLDGKISYPGGNEKLSKNFIHGMIKRQLKGHNLACWCKPGDPCHVDILLSICNDC